MTTYQDIVDYMNKNYWSGFKLVYDNPSYTINNDDDYSIIINKNSYAIIGSLAIGKGLGQLLLDILNTPVDKRIKPEIKHTVEPATAENVYTANLLTRLTSVDQVIQSINTFLVNARCNSNPIMTIATDIGANNLNKVLKLYYDYNIVITNQSHNSDVFNLLIEPK